MNVTCVTHRQPDPRCTACGLAELSKMTRRCPGCLAPCNPDGPFGLCGKDDAIHRDVEQQARKMTGVGVT